MNNPIAAKLAKLERITPSNATDDELHKWNVACVSISEVMEIVREYDDAKGHKGKDFQGKLAAQHQSFHEVYEASDGTTTDVFGYLQDGAVHITEANRRSAHPVAQAVPVAWMPIESAPKDGTLVQLLIKDDGSAELNPLEDELESRTIGSYGVHGGPEEDPEWTFAGWDWDFDSFEDGRGIPIAWAPLLPLPQPPHSAPEARDK